MKAVFKFHWDCGRQGSLNGVFVADKADVDALYGKEVWFGEVLGKHSEIYGVVDREDITLISESPEVVDVVENHGLASGFNPLDYYEPEEEADEE